MKSIVEFLVNKPLTKINKLIEIDKHKIIDWVCNQIKDNGNLCYYIVESDPLDIDFHQRNVVFLGFGNNFHDILTKISNNNIAIDVNDFPNVSTIMEYPKYNSKPIVDYINEYNNNILNTNTHTVNLVANTLDITIFSKWLDKIINNSKCKVYYFND